MGYKEYVVNSYIYIVGRWKELGFEYSLVKFKFCSFNYCFLLFFRVMLKFVIDVVFC